MNEPNKLDPKAKDFLELLEALKGEVHTGRLKVVTFMLVDPRNADIAMIDSYGRPDVVEIAGRKSVERVAQGVELINPGMAKAIRDGLPAPRVTN